MISVELNKENALFKTILVPVDGSANALSAAHFAITVAQSCHASIVALYVASPFQRFFHASVMNHTSSDFQQEFEAAEIAQANAAIAQVQVAAQSARVTFLSSVVFDKLAARAIVSACKSFDADLVVIGSHGYQGIKKLLLGSTTQEVLVRIGATPVLVHRDQALEMGAGWEEEQDETL